MVWVRSLLASVASCGWERKQCRSMAALGDRDRTGTRSVLFRRGAAAYGDASRRLAGARTQERAFLRGPKSELDAMLNGAAPHSKSALAPRYGTLREALSCVLASASHWEASP